MARKSEQVVQGVFAMLEGALPGADVLRNRSKPTRIGPGGAVIVRDGEQGDPDILLSPLSYTYTHEVLLDVAVLETSTVSREQALDQLLGEIGLAIEADRTLGGLCEWMEAVAPVPEDAEAIGIENVRWTELSIACTYTTSGPLA